jgi:ParB/RepB/Spo0J family partition protein
VSPEYREIPVDLIRFSPFNTRGEVPAEELESLAETMKAEGINTVPIKVRPVEGEAEPDTPIYGLVYGERRLRALILAGLPLARCIVQEMTDAEVLMEQWVENEEHRDIPDYGKAQKLKQLLDALKVNQADLAAKLGKSQPWISVHFSMLRLEPFITRVIMWLLSEKQARAILAAPEDLIPAVCREVEAWMALKGALPSAEEIRGIVSLLRTEAALSVPEEHTCVASPGTTNCRICGRPLTAPESVAAGIGPVCAEGKPEISEASPQTIEELTLEERVFKELDDLHAKFGEPSQSWMRGRLYDVFHLYVPDADKLIAKYRARAAKAEAPPFKLVVQEDPEETPGKAIALCPLCGKPNLQPDLDQRIETLVRELQGKLPLGMVAIVEEALRRRMQ